MTQKYKAMRPTLFFTLLLFSLIVHSQLAEPFQDVNGKWGLINCDKNSILIPPHYDFVSDFSEGLALVRKPDSQKGFGGIISFIDKAGKTVIDLPNAKFSDNTIIRNGFALLENKDGSFNLIDKSEKLVKELN